MSDFGVKNARILGGQKMVKFRGSRIQGQLPRQICQFMGLLLEQKLISLSAEALMEERGLTIGSQVAFSLR